MKKRIIVPITILMIILIISCNKNSDENDTMAQNIDILSIVSNPSGSNKDTPVEISNSNSSILVESLNLREYPSLGSKTLETLTNNSIYTIISYTSWEETILDFTGPWFEVEFNSRTGWIFGGMIDIAINYKEHIDKSSIENEDFPHTSVSLDVSDLDRFPILSMRLFSADNPGLIKKKENQEIIFDNDNNLLVLYNFPKPEETITINATSPLEEEFLYECLQDNISFGGYYESGEPIVYENVMSFKFYNLAIHTTGVWKFNVIIDGKQLDEIYEVNIPALSLNVLPENGNSPFENSGGLDIEIGETVRITGFKKDCEAQYIVIYEPMEENEDVSINLYPLKAVMSFPDQYSRYIWEFEIDENFKVGQYYKVAIGNPITMITLFNSLIMIVSGNSSHIDSKYGARDQITISSAVKL